MSAEINNREYRKQVLAELIAELHNGKTADEVKDRFAAVFENVSAEEIAQAEQALIQNGLPVSEVQRLCDVHAAVFKGSISDIHREMDPSHVEGHPVHTLMAENRAVEELTRELSVLLGKLPAESAVQALRDGFARLTQIERHYSKKENLFFPYMEQYGITAPPKVMWGVDDEIRAQLKAVRARLDAGEFGGLITEGEALFGKMDEMIFKEENIMLPMLLENLTQDEWKTVADESAELGYCLIDDVPAWQPIAVPETKQVKAAPQAESGVITLPTGMLTVQELTRMLDMLPIDITFVGKDETVKYFSQGAERVFPRTKAIIGRNVSNCHPPASVHIVEKLVEDFKAGRKDGEDFWIRMGDRYILIRYFAVRSEAQEFLGVLEVTQNIAPLQAVTGEKRLVSEEA